MQRSPEPNKDGKPFFFVVKAACTAGFHPIVDSAVGLHRGDVHLTMHSQSMEQTTMNNRNRKPLIGLIALSAALAMPMAFAQSETEESAPPQTEQPTPTEATPPTETATPTESATGASVQSAEQTNRCGVERCQQGWNEVDSDKDGAISKQEARPRRSLPGLRPADGDADAS